MSALTRRQNAEAVLAHLRDIGPQTVAEIRQSLGMTKRAAEDALWLLCNRGQVENTWPSTSPLTYMASAAIVIEHKTALDNFGGGQS